MAQSDWQETYLGALYQYNLRTKTRKMVPISAFSEEIKKRASLKLQQLTQQGRI